MLLGRRSQSRGVPARSGRPMATTRPRENERRGFHPRATRRPLVVTAEDVYPETRPLVSGEAIACADWYNSIWFRWRVLIMEQMLRSRRLSAKVRKGFGDLWRNCLWRRAPHNFLRQPWRWYLLGPGALINTSRGEYVGDKNNGPFNKSHHDAYAIWCLDNFKDVDVDMNYHALVRAREVAERRLRARALAERLEAASTPISLFTLIPHTR